jgi:5-methylcytosine-specific restriction endonuclease McrA
VACRRENSRLWSAANRERHRERSRHWAAANRERAVTNSRRYYAENVEARREYSRRWAAANPEKKAATNHRRRARKAAVLSIPLPPAVIDFGPWQPCAYCGSVPGSNPIHCKSVREHMVPLVRGGSDARGNVTWACASCNSKKGAKTMEEYLLPRYLEIRRQQIAAEDATAAA